MKKMHLNGFSQACVGHHSEGQWKNPQYRLDSGYRTMDYWVELARTLERGFFDSLFLADVHGTYNVYQGSNRAAIQHGVQFPAVDPTFLIPAMAGATRHLGLACTYSTTYFPPYHTAKVFSTLDHLTNGRVAWNIVASYLKDAMADFGIQDNLSHDERYERADEYMDVVYKLWEQSWDEDAVVRDIGRDMFTDPDRVHTIHHKGRWFESVTGPHMCEPSSQRTPVLFQAGASGRGVAFAGRHAECVFTVSPTLAAGAKDVKKLRAAAVEAGRDPDDIKINQGLCIIVAPTDELAKLEEQKLRSYASPDGALALFSGWLGMDVSAIPRGEKLDESSTDVAIHSLRGFMQRIDPTRDWTLGAIADYMALGSIFPKVVGSPSTVADEMERWMDEAGMDGFNIHAPTQLSGLTDFVDLVVPELQKRGRLRTAYEGTTLRESFFGAGHKRLSARHPGRGVIGH